VTARDRVVRRHSGRVRSLPFSPSNWRHAFVLVYGHNGETSPPTSQSLSIPTTRNFHRLAGRRPVYASHLWPQRYLSLLLPHRYASHKLSDKPNTLRQFELYIQSPSTCIHALSAATCPTRNHSRPSELYDQSTGRGQGACGRRSATTVA